MNLNNLKIYCKTEEDQSYVFDTIFYDYKNTISISTWEPDGDDENPGTWGMFIDNFPEKLWYELVEFLEHESWALDEEVEMALECEEQNKYLYYPE